MEKIGFISISISKSCSIRLFRPVSDGAGGQRYLGYDGYDGIHFNCFKPQEDLLVLENSLLIPCSAHVIHTVLDYSDMQTLLCGGSSHGQYYFNEKMHKDLRFEKDNGPTLFGGPHTAYLEAIRQMDRARPLNISDIFEPEPEMSRGRQNCWTGAQGIAQYIGGIDLADIDSHLPYFYRAYQARNWYEKILETDINKRSIEPRLQKIFGPEAQPNLYISQRRNFILRKERPDSHPHILTTLYAMAIKDLLAADIDFEGKQTTLQAYLSAQEQAGKLAVSKSLSDHAHMKDGYDRTLKLRTI